MIARKPVELAFRWLPALLLPILAAPQLLTFLSQSPTEYRSSANVWISEATGLGTLSLGSENRFSSPARRQAQVLTDLLSTARFREEVAVGAGLLVISPEGSEELARRRAGNGVGASLGARGGLQHPLDLRDTPGSGSGAGDRRIGDR